MSRLTRRALLARLLQSRAGLVFTAVPRAMDREIEPTMIYMELTECEVNGLYPTMPVTLVGKAESDIMQWLVRQRGRLIAVACDAG